MDDVLNRGEIKPKSSTNSMELSFDMIDLPSKGKLYRGNSLEGKDSVEIHYLTATQEDILTSPNLLQSGKMLDALVKSVLKDKTINPEDLLLGDRNMILVWLRSTGYGEDYPVELQCSACGQKFEYTFNLSTLDIKNLDEDPDENGLYTFSMPMTKRTVKFTLLTVGDETKINKTIEDRKRKMGSQIDGSSTLRMKYMIKEIDGNTDPSVISKFCESLPVKDARAFREKVNSLEPGVVMKQEATCKHCGNVSEEVIPIQVGFFWPDTV